MNNNAITYSPPDVASLSHLGSIIAQSGMFSDARSEAQAIVKVLAGAEIGFGPIASMAGIYIVKGRVTLSANLMAAAIKRSGRYSYRVVRLDDSGCEIAFFEAGQEIGRSSFDAEDARRAGLATGENWRKFPRNMFFARALSNGAKWHCPDVFGGGPVYTPDELGAEVKMEEGEIVAVVAEVAPPPPETLPCQECGTPVIAAAARMVATRTGAVLCRKHYGEWRNTPPAGDGIVEVEGEAGASHEAS